MKFSKTRKYPIQYVRLMWYPPIRLPENFFVVVIDPKYIITVFAMLDPFEITAL